MPKTDIPLISIVSISLNNLKGLQKTYKSLSNQSFKGFEWIVVDGGSEDGTRGWLAEAPELGMDSCFLSEKDDGIYDAMNKGIEQAEGTYILFLNAGDTLAGKDTLARLAQVIRTARSPDFLYGDAYEDFQGQQVLKAARPHGKIALGMITHHQAMLYRRAALGRLRYDLRYRLAADYDFTARFLQKAKHPVYCGFPVCIFAPGGISQRQAHAARREEYAVRRALGICNPLLNAAVMARQASALLLKQTAPGLYLQSRRLFKAQHLIKGH